MSLSTTSGSLASSASSGGIAPSDSVSQVGQKRRHPEADNVDSEDESGPAGKKLCGIPSNGTVSISSFVKAVGCIIARTEDPWLNGDKMILAGTKRDPDIPEDQLSESERTLLRQYKILTDEIPMIHDQMLADVGACVSGAHFAYELSEGRRDAVSSDTNVLKAAIPGWCITTPPLSSDKSERGFRNDVTGALLCPHLSDWSSDDIKSQIRSGEIDISNDDWPNFLFEGNTCKDIEEVDQKIFRSDILLLAWKRVYFGVDCSKYTKEPRFHGRCIASKCHLVSVTPHTIAYVAMLLRSALSADLSMSTAVKDETAIFSYSAFFDGIIQYFHDEDKDITDAILLWWNERVFPARAKKSKKATTGTLALLAKRRAERRGQQGTSAGAS